MASAQNSNARKGPTAILALLLVLLLFGNCVSGYRRRKSGPVHVSWLYFFQYKWPVPTKSPTTFRVIDKHYAVDSQRAFYDAKIINGAAPASFEILRAGVSRDRHDVYFNETAIGVCDPTTFELLSYPWAKDKECAYYLNYGNNRLPADVATFKVLSRSYARDKNCVFFRGKIILEADPATFVVDRDWAFMSRAHDKRHCFEYDNVVACSL